MPLKVMATNGAMSSSAIYAALLYAADNGGASFTPRAAAST